MIRNTFMIKIVVLGSGNLATHLCQLFEKSNAVNLLQNYNRKGVSICNSNVKVTANIQEIAIADYYIVAFSDSALNQVVKNSLLFLKLNIGTVLHCSGSTPMSVFRTFNSYGVFYPLQSFQKDVAIDFSIVPLAIEASNEELQIELLGFSKQFSKTVFVMDSLQRNALHVAAVFANNFSNFIFTQVFDICDTFKVDIDLLQPLIQKTIENILTQNTQNNQTGPAVRKDLPTQKRHLNTLQDPLQKEIYRNLSRAIESYYNKE